MIELFEKIWQRELGADEVQLDKLYIFLQDNQFPVCELPDTYIELLKESNGGDFTIGNREYQLFLAEETLQAYQSYNFSVYMPFAFPFALDGCDNFYIFNLREKDDCIYGVSSSDLEWEECHKIADSFIKCLKQKKSLDEIMF
uniref:SMI1/KNR4 family protein n=1 Tax=Agathobacter sp. TaxID=2021311 RepID=UPI0040576712